VVDEQDAMVVKRREEDETLRHEVYLRDEGVWFVADMQNLMKYFEKRLVVWREHLSSSMILLVEEAEEDVQWWRDMWAKLKNVHVRSGVWEITKTSIGWVLRLFAYFINTYCRMRTALSR
jgi:hypothetical protein